MFCRYTSPHTCWVSCAGGAPPPTLLTISRSRLLLLLLLLLLLVEEGRLRSSIPLMRSSSDDDSCSCCTSSAAQCSTGSDSCWQLAISSRSSYYTIFTMWCRTTLPVLKGIGDLLKGVPLMHALPSQLLYGLKYMHNCHFYTSGSS